jgi:hypothetical protein
VSQAEENTHAPLTPDGASDHDRLAQALEREIERIREARPHLSSRLDRASNLLLLQLASPPRQRPVKVRIGSDGRRPRFLVRSLTSGGVVYCVTANTFQCSCPDALRRDQGRGCKHSLAVYILWRASRTQKRGCSACHGGWVYIREDIVDPESGEIAETINTVRCRRCGDGFSHAYVQQWLEGRKWHYARSRPANPHSYCLRQEVDDEATFECVVEHIQELGHPYPWWGAVYRQYVAGDFAYWTMSAAPRQTQLINRKTLEQVRLDQLTNKGGGGIVWPWLHKDVEAERAEMRKQESAQDELGEGA